MSDVLKDISNIGSRLFDHNGFLSGEINFLLKEFEEKRGDAEVDNLFNTIENITDIKDTHIDQLKETINESLIESNRQLSEALQLCDQFSTLQEKISKESDKNFEKWKEARTKFMDEILPKYYDINRDIAEKQEELKIFYGNLERKLN